MSKWYYNENSGLVGDDSWYNRAYELEIFGWHGPFDTKQDLFKYYADNRDAHPDWKEPTDDGWKAYKQSLETGAASVTSDVLGVGQNGVQVQNWFIRIGEILLGIVLIGVGVAKLTGATNAISKLAKVV